MTFFEQRLQTAPAALRRPHSGPSIERLSRRFHFQRQPATWGAERSDAAVSVRRHFPDASHPSAIAVSRESELLAGAACNESVLRAVLLFAPCRLRRLWHGASRRHLWRPSVPHCDASLLHRVDRAAHLRSMSVPSSPRFFRRAVPVLSSLLDFGMSKFVQTRKYFQVICGQWTRWMAVMGFGCSCIFVVSTLSVC